jgi:uncharacterized protein
MDLDAPSVDPAVVRVLEPTSLRTCIVTRAELDPSALIRFVPGPDGTITPDLARKLPGRGVWVSCISAHVAQAVRSKAFARSLKRKVIVDENLADLVDQLLVKRMIQALALANKAGLLVTGFAKVDAEVSRGGRVILIHAAEAAVDGSNKLDRKARAVAADQGRVPKIVKELTIAQLDLATGRENVVHAALSVGGAAARFSFEAERLGRYRAFQPSVAATTKAE